MVSIFSHLRLRKTKHNTTNVATIDPQLSIPVFRDINVVHFGLLGTSSWASEFLTGNTGDLGERRHVAGVSAREGTPSIGTPGERVLIGCGIRDGGARDTFTTPIPIYPDIGCYKINRYREIQAANRLQKSLRAGAPAPGAYQMLSGTNRTRAICRFAPNTDWLLVDLEHGNIANDDMHEIVVVTARALDAGTHGILVQMIKTADDGRSAAGYSKSPPRGESGF
ncbi:hypothetical protein BDV10DRAFT_187129 [Aspergillus recurvatus]